MAPGDPKVHDVTPDRQHALLYDRDAARGQTVDAIWHQVDLKRRVAEPITHPEGVRWALGTLSNGGGRILAMWSDASPQVHLGMTADRGKTWRVLHTWQEGEPAPKQTVDQSLWWDGGPVAKVIAASGGLLQIDLER